MTHPSSPPAPMTAERLNEIRDEVNQGSHKSVPELFEHIDALTARVAELERSRDGWKHDAGVYAANAQAAEAKREQADEKICQAYQIVGSLAHETNTFDVPAVQRALDYLSGDAFDANFLPWSIRALQTKDTTP